MNPLRTLHVLWALAVLATAGVLPLSGSDPFTKNAPETAMETASQDPEALEADQWFADLASGVRPAWARERLRLAGASAVGALAAGLDHPEPRARQEAVRLLAGIDTESASEALAGAALTEANLAVQREILEALVRRAAKDAELVTACLRMGLASEDTAIRWRAALTLGLLGHSDGLAELHAAVTGNDLFHRMQALEVLGRLGDESSLPLLEKLLGSSSPRDRGQAVLALGRIGGERALDLLGGMLEDRDPEVRWRTYLALGQTGDPQAAPLLQAALAKERDLQAMRHAMRALRRVEEAR